MKRIGTIAMAIMACVLVVQPAVAQGWPALYDPLTLRHFNLAMDPDDWLIIRFDETNDIEVPAMFWATGEVPILISVRRKSATPIGDKISLKLDINEFVDGQKYHGTKKLSLENGDDNDVLSEGFAWMMHRVAARASDRGYKPGLASWVTMHINGEYFGVYLNVEQRDKQFLKNRGLYTKGETWLYKIGELNGEDVKVGDPHSPLRNALNYEPFWVRKKPQPKPTPDAMTLAEELPKVINMDSLLRLSAVNAFLSAPDGLFVKGKNFYYVDYLGGPRRLYIPWDLDSTFVDRTSSIYRSSKRGKKNSSQDTYTNVIIGNPLFRAQYNQIMQDLLAGPFQRDGLIAFIDALEVMLTPALLADVNNNFDGTVPEQFRWVRGFVTDRILNVGHQLQNDTSRSETLQVQ